MRNFACRRWVELSSQRELVFLTGDLGFNALEPLAEALGERFINAGVAEQNMVTVAAGLCAEGMSPWVYSIAPFCYARAYEQIRNDVCLHKLPVKLVGNGGGYGYGVMGGSHHALEDYGVLLALPHLRAFVPAFRTDVGPAVDRMAAARCPGYLRLGRCEWGEQTEPPEYAPWRHLLAGDGPVCVAVGPLAGSLVRAAEALPKSERPDVWVVAELPIDVPTLPDELVHALRRTGSLCVAEEHVARGSVGRALVAALASEGIVIGRFAHVHARGYPSGTYGSQRFHRRQSGLDPSSLLEQCRSLGARA